jgi:hypothetical protein
MKTIALFIAGVLGVMLTLGTAMWAGAGSLAVRHCAGRLHDCYVAARMPDRLKRMRVGALSQFAASKSAIAFPVVVNQNTGLLIFDRSSGQSKVIYENGFGLWSPSFSADGTRLLLVISENGTARRQILSCVVVSWRCSVLLKTNDNLRSPVDAGNGEIVYSASPLHVVGDRAYYSDWNLYDLKPGANPVQLSKFDFYELHSINVVNGRIIFSAVGPKPDNPVIPKSKPLAPDQSEIYAVTFNRAAGQIAKPVAPLSPLFLMGGLSIAASVSADGTRAAVTNTQTGHFRYRDDLVLIDGGRPDRRLVLKGLGFSSPAFVGETLVFSEMFDGRYDLRLFDFSDDSLRTIASINAEPAELRKLERVHLTIENAPQG